MVDDPRLIVLQRTLQQRPPRRLPRRLEAREAAVSLILRPRDEMELLLIKRAEFEGDPWSGHMALPGGRRDAVDADLVDTAFRETAEETGIQLGRNGLLLGALDEVRPRSPRLPPVLIAPYVVGVLPDTAAYPDAREVEAALWVPLSALRDPGAASEMLIELEGSPLAFPAFRYQQHVIWGLTHRILAQFLELAGECGI